MKRLILLFVLMAVAGVAQQQPYFSCTQFQPLNDVTTSGTFLVQGAGQQTIRLCAIYIQVVQPSSPADFSLVYGKGTNCGSGQGTIFKWSGVASTTQDFAHRDAGYMYLPLPTGNDVCLKLSAAPTKAQVWLIYALL